MGCEASADGYVGYPLILLEVRPGADREWPDRRVDTLLFQKEVLARHACEDRQPSGNAPTASTLSSIGIIGIGAATASTSLTGKSWATMSETCGSWRRCVCVASVGTPSDSSSCQISMTARFVPASGQRTAPRLTICTVPFARSCGDPTAASGSVCRLGRRRCSICLLRPRSVDDGLVDRATDEVAPPSVTCVAFGD